MSALVQKYMMLYDELLLKRLEHDFTQDEESEYVEKFDEIWWVMSDEEQADIEYLIKSPSAPTDLQLEDVEVALGSKTMPRRSVEDE